MKLLSLMNGLLTKFERNAPYILGCRAFTAALAAGNTTVLKGSEASPRCFYAIADIFHEAGLPKGCLNLLFVEPKDAPEVTTALIAHPAVNKINFTGSTAVGKIIAAQAGKHLKPILLELGGKATAIVCEDADLQKAAMGSVVGAFLHVSISQPVNQGPD
jgi:acyl-CoA reductase-like NAD-dependent aldehyde dehydrogenase